MSTITRLLTPDCRLIGTLFSAMLLGACSLSLAPPLKPAHDPSFSYSFPGFKLTPPASNSWLRDDNTTSALFYNPTSKPAIFRLRAVVQQLHPAISQDANENFSHYIERLLHQNLAGNTKLDLLKLTTKAETINQANCVSYEAWQGKRHFPPLLEPQLDYIHYGYVCQHPLAPHVLIQGFYTEQHQQDTYSNLPAKERDEANTLIRQIEFTPL
jgi:hypothetical protein